jgi:dTDP-glucose 4,6-dehydratase
MKPDGLTYAILGGGGSFAIHTALYLLEHANPAKVVGIGRAPLRPRAFSLGVEDDPRYEYRAYHIGYEQDLLLEYLDALRPNIIINFAAQGEGAVSWKHSWRFFDTNATALVRLVESLTKRGWLYRFIQIGTSELYGSVTAPADENAPLKPTSPYAASKAAFDWYLSSAHQQLRFPMNILRPSNCYCPGQLLHRIIPKCYVYGLLRNERVPLHGGGAAKKSYLHVRDLARAIALVSDAGLPGRVYNIGPKYPTSIHEVVQRCAEEMGLTFEALCEVAPERLGQDSCYWLDSSAAERDLGWRQEIDWDAGLEEMHRWVLTHAETLANWPTDYRLRA